MTATLATLAYLAITAVVWARIYRWLYNDFHGRYRHITWGDGDRMFGIVWGGFVALYWPVSVPMFGLIWVGKRIAAAGVLGVLMRFERRIDERTTR